MCARQGYYKQLSLGKSSSFILPREDFENVVMFLHSGIQWKLVALRVLTESRVRTGGVQGNQIHSSTLWTPAPLGLKKNDFFPNLMKAKCYY